LQLNGYKINNPTLLARVSHGRTKLRPTASRAASSHAGAPEPEVWNLKSFVVDSLEPTRCLRADPMLGIRTHARQYPGISRRSVLKAGFLGLTGLSLADLLRLRAQGAAKTRDTAVILIWLDGGRVNWKTYDPKPDAPTEYRGPYQAIRTKVPGIQVCEMLPHHARHADQMAFIRSVHHDNADHFAGHIGC